MKLKSTDKSTAHLVFFGVKLLLCLLPIGAQVDAASLSSARAGASVGRAGINPQKAFSKLLLKLGAFRLVPKSLIPTYPSVHVELHKFAQAPSSTVSF